MRPFSPPKGLTLTDIVGRRHTQVEGRNVTIRELACGHTQVELSGGRRALTARCLECRGLAELGVEALVRKVES